MAEAAASFVDKVVPTPEATNDTDGGNSSGDGGNSGAGGGERADAHVDAPERKEGGGSGDGGKQQPDATADTSDAAVKTVPLAALQEARAELKALKAEISELKSQPRLTAEEKQRLARLEEKRDEKKEEIKDPEFLEDPKGYIDTKLGKALKKLEELENTGKQKFSEMDQQTQIANVVQHVQAQEAEFRQKTPDYAEALAHVRNVRTQQLKMLFPQATEQQISQQVSREEFGAAQQIAMAGGNVPEFAYNYAKTFGYQPKTNGADKGEKKPDKSAARSLGGGGGAAQVEEDEGSGNEFKSALAERFGVRKRG